MLEGDVTDFFANWDKNKSNFIRIKSFLEGAIAIETDEKKKKEMMQAIEDIEFQEGVVIMALRLFKKQEDLQKQIDDLKHETEKNHNNNLEKIIKLNKGMDNLQKRMDK